MNLILLGPPGAGKGTVAAAINEEYNLPHISTGDLFRNAIKEKTELGKKVEAIIQSGELVADELTISIVKERLDKPDTKKGVIFDGFPRTQSQAVALEKIIKIDMVMNFVVTNDIVLFRLSGRQVCRVCGRIYHATNMPPSTPGVCDDDGGELYTRPDDMEDSIKHRLEVYYTQTSPLISFYEDRGLVQELDLSGHISKTLEQVRKILG